ncbi:Arp complex subunit [Saitoella coloradoensis]
MILLDYQNTLLSALLTDRLLPPSTSNPNNSTPRTASLDQIITDFDGVLFHLSTPESKTKIIVSIRIKCWEELVGYGVDKVLEEVYGRWGVVREQVEEGWDWSLEVDVEKEYENTPLLIHEISLLKRHALSAPFVHAFSISSSLPNPADTPDTPASKPQVLPLHYRDTEAIYLLPSHDRTTIIFSTHFREETDRVFGKVFLQEFVDARRRPALQTSPQVLYTTGKPPRDLESLGLGEDEGMGYVTFILFPRHTSTNPSTNPSPSPIADLTRSAQWETISQIQLFRDYLHYHIKCSKAFMHSRMRARTGEWLKVLRRAAVEREDVGSLGGRGEERRGMSGRWVGGQVPVTARGK